MSLFHSLASILDFFCFFFAFLFQFHISSSSSSSDTACDPTIIWFLLWLEYWIFFTLFLLLFFASFFPYQNWYCISFGYWNFGVGSVDFEVNWIADFSVIFGIFWTFFSRFLLICSVWFMNFYCRSEFQLFCLKFTNFFFFLNVFFINFFSLNYFIWLNYKYF